MIRYYRLQFTCFYVERTKLLRGGVGGVSLTSRSSWCQIFKLSVSTSKTDVTVYPDRVGISVFAPIVAQPTKLKNV